MVLLLWLPPWIMITLENFLYILIQDVYFLIWIVLMSNILVTLPGNDASDEGETLSCGFQMLS